MNAAHIVFMTCMYIDIKVWLADRKQTTVQTRISVCTLTSLMVSLKTKKPLDYFKLSSIL